MGLKLRPYQDDAADFLFEHDTAMILAPVGAGKTAITLTALAAAVSDGYARRWLILAPKRVCTDVWPVERPKWGPRLTMALAVGTPAQRAAALASDADVVVMNYDNIQTLTEADMARFDGVVFDELTRVKNPSGKRFKALEKLLKGVRYRWGLTGSFTSNGLEDVFGQCKIVDQALLGRSKGAFLQRYFVCINRDFGEWSPRKGSLEQIMATIKPATFVLEPGVYADKLPPLHTVELACDMADIRPYNVMKRDLMLELGSAQVVAANAAAVTSKLQQIACIAEGTLVLTKQGWMPIEQISTEKIWDGVRWVTHSGLVNNGTRPVYDCHGVKMTYDHKVLTVSGWRTAREILDGSACGKFGRAKVRLPRSVNSGRDKRAQLRAVALPLRMWKRNYAEQSIPSRYDAQNSTALRVQTRQHNARNDGHSPAPDMVEHARPMHEPAQQRLQELWLAGHKSLRGVARVRSILGRYVRDIRRCVDLGSNRHEWPVQQNELPLGNLGNTSQQQTREQTHSHAGRVCDFSASSAAKRNANANSLRAALPVPLAVGKSVEYTVTYDILNCGPRNRFVTRSSDGTPLIVHNCGFVYHSTSTASDRPGKFDVDKRAIWISGHKFDRLAELLDENQRANTIVVYNYIEELAELRRRFPHAQTIDDPNAIERWNAGRIELLLVHPKSAGHGLNLQHGGNKIVFVSLPWSLELYEQTVGRLHRGGQTQPVWCYLLLCNKTIDERIWSALRDKRAISDIALEELKA